MDPLVPPTLDLVRFGRVAIGVSGPSPHCLSPGVFNRSPSSSKCVDTPMSPLLALREFTGGEGVDIGADDGAVVPEDVEGTRRL